MGNLAFGNNPMRGKFLASKKSTFHANPAPLFCIRLPDNAMSIKAPAISLQGALASILKSKRVPLIIRWHNCVSRDEIGLNLHPQRAFQYNNVISLIAFLLDVSAVSQETHVHGRRGWWIWLIETPTGGVLDNNYSF